MFTYFSRARIGGDCILLKTIGGVVSRWFSTESFFKSDKFRVKSDKFRVKSDKFRVKSDKFRVKSDKFRVKSDKFGV